MEELGLSRINKGDLCQTKYDRRAVQSRRVKEENKLVKFEIIGPALYNKTRY